MTLDFGFQSLVEHLERALVRDLALSALELPIGLARLEGRWRERAITLEARAYRSPAMRYVRFVVVRGPELEIGNVLCMSAPALGLPLFGADLVSLGRDTAVVVADLSPVRVESASQLQVLRRHLAGAPRWPRESELPAWASQWFSPDALVTRVPHDRAASVRATLEAYTAAFVELTATATPRPDEAARVDARQHAYGAAHRQHDRGLQLLRRMFEPEAADRFLRQVLFPEVLPA